MMGAVGQGQLWVELAWGPTLLKYQPNQED